MAKQSTGTAAANERETVLLLDGFYLLFRAFNAVPDTFATSAGEPTNAVYGFTSVLLKTIASLRPEYVIVAFDSSGPTFRHEEYPEYKANRPPMDETLRVQIPRVRQLVEAFGFPVCEAERAEADDVIGSLAVKATAAGLATAIVSGDMDLLQLVDEQVSVVWPGRRISDYTIYDRAKVQERYELLPEQVPDFKALAGDSSDNIKGLRGVGKKTAVRWLHEWGTTDEIVAHAEQAPEAVSDRRRRERRADRAGPAFGDDSAGRTVRAGPGARACAYLHAGSGRHAVPRTGVSLPAAAAAGG